MAFRRSGTNANGSKDYLGNEQHAGCKCRFGLGNRDQGSPRQTADGYRLVSDFSGLIEREGFQLLAISAEHGIRAGLLPGPHKDPFDRMLIAQSQAENTPIVSKQALFESYGVRRLW